MTKLVPTALGAASITAAMTVAVKKPPVMLPLFLGGWGAVGYGVTDGFKEIKAPVAAGIGGVILGAIGTRMAVKHHAPAMLRHAGQATFVAGWGSLAYGIAKQQGISPAWTLIPAGIIIASAYLIQRRAFGKPLVPRGIPELAFAGGWAGLVTVSTKKK